MKTQRGRPKGQLTKNDQRSFGPLGDLLRKHRFKLGLGLSDVAESIHCSVQFISNIEHGRAPLPWDKLERLAVVLKASEKDLRAANLASRAEFRSYIAGQKTKKTNMSNVVEAASSFIFAAEDSGLVKVIQKYQRASDSSRKKLLKTASEILAH